MVKRAYPVEARFLSKVKQGDSCWEWTAGKNWKDYGKFWFEGKTQPAHRVAYILTHGSIPAGLTIDHLCRNRACVKPDHLEAVTIQENLRRSPIRPEALTNCPQGHAYTAGNTYSVRSKGGFMRMCATCCAERYRRRRASGRRQIQKLNGKAI